MKNKYSFFQGVVNYGKCKKVILNLRKRYN